MKKVFVLSMMAFLYFNASAESNYPDDVVVSTPQAVISDDTDSGVGYYGLGFYSYDGAEFYGLSFGAYNFNGVGLGVNIRSNWKFSNHQNVSNADLVLNYSFGVYSNSDVKILVTPEIGPSLRQCEEYDRGDFKEKYYCDGFAGIKATLAYKKVVLSAGYHIWAPKWKFGKNYKADGFYAQLGINL